MNLVQGARDLVDRSRQGDQNAMAIIALVGRKGRKENAPFKNRIAYAAIRNAIKETSDIGDEAPNPPKGLLKRVNVPDTFLECFLRLLPCKNGYCACVVCLANGGPLSLRKLTELIEASEGHPLAKRAVAEAHALQLVRNGKAPLKALSPSVSWELGE